MPTLQEISQLSEEEVEAQLEENSPKVNSSKLNKRTLDLCYDKEYCRGLKVDYLRLPPSDIKKVRLAAFYSLKGKLVF